MTTAPHLPAATADSLAPAFSPLYQQIKTLILRSLQAGEWKPGEPIPSEVELAARFRVSQGTMRKAIDELALAPGDRVFALVKSVALDERAVAAVEA